MKEAAQNDTFGHGAVEESVVDIPKHFIDTFSKLIRYSRSLQTLSVNNCGLSAQVLVGLVPALRHAKSLICLHVGANSGFSEKVVNYYIERLKILPENRLRLQIETEKFAQLSLQEL